MAPRTQRLRTAAAVAATVLLAAGAAMLPAQAEAQAGAQAQAAGAAGGGDLTHLVDSFIGTQNDGNTYPGAAVPFGMVQLSPDTGHNTGYDYNQDHIRGFSAVHLSGVGCGLGGDLPVLPTTGAVTATDDAQYAAPFSHADESASPGYYKVALGTGITAELSATDRTGWQRYTFPATDQANVLLNSGQALHKVTSSTVTVLDDRTVVTAITGSGFCQDTVPYTVYTETRFDRPFASYGTWKGTQVTAGSRSSTSTGLGGAYVRFDTTQDRSVTAVTSLSWVDARGAAANLAAEGRGSFDRTAAAAKQAWQTRLSGIRVQGGTDEQQRTFYSSLYRSFLAPNIGSDVDGRYTGWDGKAHAGDGAVYYQNWSLWDTYRTQQQLLSLLAPRESRDMALSLLKIAQQSGSLPRWGYATVETNIMTGDPVTPFLVDAYRQGLLKGHEEEAYRALKKHADTVPPASSPAAGRQADAEYLAGGYVPYDPAHPGKPGDNDFQHGPSATLEYALADAALGGMARDLGHTADARRYLARGQNYRNILDPRTGFFRARDTDGGFVGPADPAASTGFHEGTAWQYMWLVPQDVPGLVGLIGSTQAANDRLDSFFAYDQLVADPAGTARNVWVNGPYSYYNQDKYNPQNEPDLSAPYTYLSTGQPWKTTDVVHAALTLFTDAPNGVTGNDDLGTMSAWQVLSAIGVYPMTPGTDLWGLSTPLFSRVDVTLDKRYYPHGNLTVTAPGSSATDRYIQSARLGGHQLTHTYLTTGDIRAGKDIALTVGASPSAWGTAPSDAPPALDTASDTQRRTAASVSPSPVGVLGGGTAADVTVSAVLTAPGQASGTVTVTAPAPLTADPTSGSFTVTSNTLPATHEVPVHITAPAGTPDGTYPVTVEVSQENGPSVTRTVQVSVTTATCEGTAGSCPQDLSAQYDVDGVGTAGGTGADFDGTGTSFPAEQLPAPGTGVLDGRAYAFPDTAGSAPNFATAHGQTLPLVRRTYSALDVLLTAHHGDVSGTATVHYADGTTADVALNATDWAAGGPRLGEDTAIHADTRYNSAGARDGVGVSIWHVALPLDRTRTAVSLTLPDDTRLALYAVSGRDA
ncbi:GH92 family glycosyl hydrolase [Streptomyces bryophytorum]|uniref:Alpha-1,2-mannosidase n=1 Tax=Actinacidiphila bryophytorum TaxID=1436133 RepID=A0A9W4H3M3_9ACTN|nr:GH92 family glycosyl hydrolase [Actinacidiphila bryophytorum]CAG7647650.1 putative Alpha-1,2-mannosidase [Actinacidiphila bryophytorum]